MSLILLKLTLNSGEQLFRTIKRPGKNSYNKFPTGVDILFRATKVFTIFIFKGLTEHKPKHKLNAKNCKTQRMVLTTWHYYPPLHCLIGNTCYNRPNKGIRYTVIKIQFPRTYFDTSWFPHPPISFYGLRR